MSFYDEQQKRKFQFLTNNFRLAATPIAATYEDRWALKQNLKIKTFKGFNPSEGAYGTHSDPPETASSTIELIGDNSHDAVPLGLLRILPSSNGGPSWRRGFCIDGETRVTG